MQREKQYLNIIRMNKPKQKQTSFQVNSKYQEQGGR